MGKVYTVTVKGKYAQKGADYVNLNVATGGGNPDGGLLRALRKDVVEVLGSVPDQFEITGWTDENVVEKKHIKK